MGFLMDLFRATSKKQFKIVCILLLIAAGFCAQPIREEVFTYLEIMPEESKAEDIEIAQVEATEELPSNVEDLADAPEEPRYEATNFLKEAFMGSLFWRPISFFILLTTLCATVTLCFLKNVKQKTIERFNEFLGIQLILGILLTGIFANFMSFSGG